MKQDDNFNNNNHDNNCDNYSNDSKLSINPTLLGYDTDELFEVSNHIYEDIEVYKNVTVVISRCTKCGDISIGWFKQDNTEEVDLDDWTGKPE